ncbi:hypothetical protein QZH41_000238 [Actinostola sp. cb2023]|nr:hypothetical protein QZH41_000238 [Actinostola sp. cb2023]
MLGCPSDPVSHLVKEEFDTLYSLLSELEPRERCCTVKDWSSGGQVLLDFLKVTRKFKYLSEGSLEPTKYNFEEIHMQLSSLCTRIEGLPSVTAQDRLCQYELAQRCANYLKVATLELYHFTDHVADESHSLLTICPRHRAEYTLVPEATISGEASKERLVLRTRLRRPDFGDSGIREFLGHST